MSSVSSSSGVGDGGASTASTAEMASAVEGARGSGGKQRDFSNPVFDAMRSMENAAAVAAASTPPSHPLDPSSGPPPLPPDDDSDTRHEPTPFDEADIRAGFEPPSAVIAPSSVTHKSSPKQQVKKPKEMAPSKVDTGKDTQCLVEEGEDEEEEENVGVEGQDYSEC